MKNVFKKNRVSLFEPQGRPISGVDLSFIKNCGLHHVFRFILDNASSLRDIGRLNGFLPPNCQVFRADIAQLVKVRRAMNKPFIPRDNDDHIRLELADLSEGRNLTPYYSEFLSSHLRNQNIPYFAPSDTLSSVIFPSCLAKDPKFISAFCGKGVDIYLSLHGAKVSNDQIFDQKGASICIHMVFYENKLTADLTYAIRAYAEKRLILMKSPTENSSFGVLNFQFSIDADPFIRQLSQEKVGFGEILGTTRLYPIYHLIPHMDFFKIMNLQLKNMGFEDFYFVTLA